MGLPPSVDSFMNDERRTTNDDRVHKQLIITHSDFWKYTDDNKKEKKKGVETFSTLILDFAVVDDRVVRWRSRARVW